MADSSDDLREDSSGIGRMRDLTASWVKNQSIISAYISANVIDAHHVEDIVQEVAQVCAEKFAEFDPQRSFVSWAMGIARNRILKYYRTRARDKLVLGETALARLESALEQLEPEAEDRREALRLCMQRIEGRRRQILELRYGENVKVADIAGRSGMSPTAVSVMLHRVRSDLLECIRRTLASQGI